MGVIDNTITIVIIGGIGYLAYDYSQHGFCGGILKPLPICGITNIGSSFMNFFKSSYDTGDAGVPFELEACQSGYTDFGLTCTRCMSAGDCFSGRGCGCNTVGKLDNQKCPSSHPDKSGLLCYKSCPKGWVHVEGMPYLCRDGAAGKGFWDSVVSDNWKSLIPGASFF